MLFSEAIASMRRRPEPASEPLLTTDLTRWNAMLGGSITLADGLTASYQQIYRSQPWVFAAVNTIARGMMRMPIKTYQRTDDEKVRVTDGDLYRLTEQQPAYRWTPSRHREAIAKQVAIYGNSIVVKLGMDGEAGVPDERFISPAIGWAMGSGDTYIWTDPKDGKRYPFQRWQIEHYRFWDTDENGFGISPLEPLRVTLANDDAARRYGLASFKHGAHPGSILRTDKELKQETANALGATWNSIHGGPDQAFKTAVLTHGLDYMTLEHDLEKAAVVPHRELTPVEVAAVYCIPASMIGWTKEANFASVDMYHTMLYQDSLGAWVVMFEETLQTDLVAPMRGTDDLFCEIDMNAVLRGDISTRYRAYATGITSGFLKPEEARGFENLPPTGQPEANRIHIPSNLSGATGAQNAEDSGKPDEQPVTTQNGRASLNGVSR